MFRYSVFSQTDYTFSLSERQQMHLMVSYVYVYVEERMYIIYIAVSIANHIVKVVKYRPQRYTISTFRTFEKSQLKKQLIILI